MSTPFISNSPGSWGGYPVGTPGTVANPIRVFRVYSQIPVPPVSEEELRLRERVRGEFAARSAQMVRAYPGGVPIGAGGRLPEQWSANPPGPAARIFGIASAVLAVITLLFVFGAPLASLSVFWVCVGLFGAFACLVTALIIGFWRDYSIIRADYCRFHTGYDSGRVYYRDIQSWAFDGIYLTLDTPNVSLNLPVNRVDCTWIIAQIIHRDRYGFWAQNYLDAHFTECLAVAPDWWMALSRSEYERIRGFVLPIIFNNSVPNLLANSPIPSATNEYLMSPQLNPQGYVEPRRQDVVLHGPIGRESWAEFLFWTSLNTLPRRSGSSSRSSGSSGGPSGDGGSF